MRCCILVLLSAFFFGCKEDDLIDLKIQDDLSISTINGTWKVIAYKELDIKKVITKDSSNSWGFDVIITFDDTVNPLKITGRNTTNSIFGEFEYINDRSVRILTLGSTYVGQPEWGDKFIDLVSESDLIFEVNESQLRIVNNQKQRSALFERE